ncbi:MAG: hypothetical protein IKA51_04415 [Clostridia bacterium]|nr:hypothetical protein [Clostridia bacterium]
MSNDKSNKYVKFKKKHPKLHVVNVFASCFLPLLLVAVFGLLSVIDGRDLLIVYAAFGSLIFGLGLSFWAYSDYDTDILKNFSGYCIGIGALICAFNLFLACSNSPSIKIEDSLLNAQILLYMYILFIVCLPYVAVRDAMKDYISSYTGLTTNQIEKRTEGFLNYLFYSKIHKEKGIGGLYYLNGLFIISVVLSLVTVTLLIYVKSLLNTVLIISMISAALSVILNLFELMMFFKHKKNYYKSSGNRPFFSKSPYAEIVRIILILVLTWVLIRDYIL